MKGLFLFLVLVLQFTSYHANAIARGELADSSYNKLESNLEFEHATSHYPRLHYTVLALINSPNYLPQPKFPIALTNDHHPVFYHQADSQSEDETGSTNLQKGSTNPQNGYIKPQSGSTSLQSGSTNLQSGSTSPQNGYIKPQSGSTNLQSGSTSLQSGSTNLQSGFTNPQSGSTNLQSGSTNLQSGPTPQDQFQVTHYKKETLPLTRETKPEAENGPSNGTRFPGVRPKPKHLKASRERIISVSDLVKQLF